MTLRSGRWALCVICAHTQSDANLTPAIHFDNYEAPIGVLSTGIITSDECGMETGLGFGIADHHQFGI